jgi:hypothetical protein
MGSQRAADQRTLLPLDSGDEPDGSLRILIPVWINAGTLGLVRRDQQSLAGHKVHLQPDSIRILEDKVVVARREIPSMRPRSIYASIVRSLFAAAFTSSRERARRQR